MRRAPLSAASVTIVHPQGFLAPLATIATDSNARSTTPSCCPDPYLLGRSTSTEFFRNCFATFELAREKVTFVLGGAK